ncbi:hypothetical protein B0H13DRAFT_2461583 [Mycena leptocephala]|nr:hypothetical protein B0H13DRAFT_2461583 [Mycena leptocephala]
MRARILPHHLVCPTLRVPPALALPVLAASGSRYVYVANAYSVTTPTNVRCSSPAPRHSPLCVWCVDLPWLCLFSKICAHHLRPQDYVVEHDHVPPAVGDDLGAGAGARLFAPALLRLDPRIPALGYAAGAFHGKITFGSRPPSYSGAGPESGPPPPLERSPGLVTCPRSTKGMLVFVTAVDLTAYTIPHGSRLLFWRLNIFEKLSREHRLRSEINGGDKHQHTAEGPSLMALVRSPLAFDRVAEVGGKQRAGEVEVEVEAAPHEAAPCYVAKEAEVAAEGECAGDVLLFGHIVEVVEGGGGEGAGEAARSAQGVMRPPSSSSALCHRRLRYRGEVDATSAWTSRREEWCAWRRGGSRTTLRRHCPSGRDADVYEKATGAG